MSRPALPEEKGAGLRRDPADPVPEALRHSVERIDDHDGPPFERCEHCERAGSIRSINPFARCPGRSLPSDVEQRAERADADDEQEVLA
jgi:hypothetical protein